MARKVLKYFETLRSSTAVTSCSGSSVAVLVAGCAVRAARSASVLSSGLTMPLRRYPAQSLARRHPL
jgi:hypothetical protein